MKKITFKNAPIKYSTWMKKLDDLLDIVDSDYTPSQWKRKREVDKKRYELIKSFFKTYNTFREHEWITWDVTYDPYDLDFDAVESRLREKYEYVLDEELIKNV